MNILIKLNINLNIFYLPEEFKNAGNIEMLKFYVSSRVS